MQIRHLKSIVSAGESPSRVSASAWSMNNQKLAVAGADRVITLYDETGERKDRFSTKPADPKSAKSYYICSLAFSPDSTKLAVAQSDCVVFVYKLGLEWGEKKSICNKLIQTAEITCLSWPKEQPNAVVFGMMDGKVRVGNLKTNKAATLYQTESCVVSVSSSLDGNAIITGHLDGSINRFFFDDGISGASQGKFTTHTCVPNAIGWGEHVIAAGSDKCVVFYNNDGRVLQDFDYSRDEEEQEFTVIEFSPSGQSVVVGSFNRFHIYNFSIAKRTWEEAPLKIIDNFYTVTSLAWKPDGSRLIAGNMCGAVEMFDCCLRRSRYKGKFEFTYVSPSQVIVKRLSTGSRIVLKSHYGYEIQKVNIFQDQFLIANTPDTLLMGDLASCKLSEIPWHGEGNEKFHFENANVCMVFNAGELSLIEYGVNEILGSCRTEHMNPHLISVRLNERKSEKDVKRIAYLIDLQTIHVMDLVSGLNLAAISHDAKVDWLELSGKANKLLFRDRRQQLHLYDLATQNRTTLLHYCSYVQWVPDSDVVVAQSRNNLCIWYAIDSPERVTMFPIKGDVEDIEREGGKTEVVVDEGVNTVSYTLDESLIEFGTALDDKDYERAIVLLETLETTPESQAMWKSLSAVALHDEKIMIAQRCFSALGDVAMARYLGNLSDKVESMDGESAYLVRARLAVLDKQFNLAESILLENGKIDDCMKMYQEMHKWDKSIKVAEFKNHADLDHMKKNYFQWLIDSGQEDKAGELKEEEGEIIPAINLYLKGGMPARAAFLLNKSGLKNVDIMERVASALFKSGLFEKAGELFEKLDSCDRALDAYKRGKAFRAAVELSRSMYPQQVIVLEEQWGDHLVSQKQMDAAINHYIEAGKSFKAIEAAIAAKQWKKAVGIVDCLDPPESGKPYFLELAKHFASVPDYPLAEKYYVAANKPQEAVDMYTKANKWEKAHTLATSFMNPEEVAFLYVSQAKEMEAAGKLKEAEKLYLTVREPDLAINMYKNHKHYDQMIRLVTSYHKELLTETHLYLGKTLETEGNFKLAEQHYVEGKDWKAAINMYCANNMYEDAYRVAKSYGGSNSTKQVAYLWARSLGGESAVKLLTKFGLLEAAIDFATENGAFDFAFELSRFADKFKLSDIHYKHAMFLEDEGKFKDAESAFILAGKPKEAILMYIHTENWAEALHVAETYEPSSAPDVLISQAKVAYDRKDYGAMETLMLRAQRPDLALKLYKDSDMWKECLQFAKQHAPNRVADLHEEYNRVLTSRANSSGGKEEILQSIRVLEQQKDFTRAIDLYLKFNVPQVTDVDFLEQVWEKAAELAMKFVPDRGQEVVTTVCSRLIGIKKFEQAAEFYMSVEMYRDAIDCFARVGLWDKAKEVVNIAPRFGEYLENTYISHLKTQQNADALVNVDATAGLDLFAQRGEWDKCLEKASGVGPEVMHKYLTIYSVNLIKEENYDLAAQTIVKYGVQQNSTNLDIYLRLTREILHRGSFQGLSAVRDLLFKLIAISPNIKDTFQKYLFIVHILTLRNYCAKKRELAFLAARQSISLLRYIGDIPPDRAFYEAGHFSKLAGINNMAFVCWNRYLDISDAIEEGDASLLENSDFANTDVPFDVELPTENSNEKQRDTVRDWVLQVSLDQKIKQEVDRRNCDDCGTRIYDASLSCFNCRHTSEACIITGYPISRNKVKCSNCNKCANKDDWNKFTMIERVCPWCGTNQQPVFLG
ncbi:hypothetical protein HDU78_005723 [Chytriomyces hyalinus]|nr:hypothetical protein HDU78_005723 [Chytriomyces hyalinus]KAJ3264591.1 hypothetical protein HDU77_008101 [Chytriomyces hyalinus]